MAGCRSAEASLDARLEGPLSERASWLSAGCRDDGDSLAGVCSPPTFGGEVGGGRFLPLPLDRFLAVGLASAARQGIAACAHCRYHSTAESQATEVVARKPPSRSICSWRCRCLSMVRHSFSSIAVTVRRHSFTASVRWCSPACTRLSSALTVSISTIPVRSCELFCSWFALLLSSPRKLSKLSSSTFSFLPIFSISTRNVSRPTSKRLSSLPSLWTSLLRFPMLASNSASTSCRVTDGGWALLSFWLVSIASLLSSSNLVH
mmetsp:Transcript_75889/g.180336  ORF Transcript_75889/g.180336 Transcript_75889/m.180336 type:complete len:262 (+) Transcript_75889:446-1231(+)